MITLFERLLAPDSSDNYFRLEVWRVLGEAESDLSKLPVSEVRYLYTKYLSYEDTRIHAWIKEHCKEENK